MQNNFALINMDRLGNGRLRVPGRFYRGPGVESVPQTAQRQTSVDLAESESQHPDNGKPEPALTVAAATAATDPSIHTKRHTRGAPPGRVAFVMSHGLGDTLVCMVIVRNLRRHGIAVDVYGDTAYALRAWFPNQPIQPLPAERQGRNLMASYGTVLQMEKHEPYADLIYRHPGAIHLREILYARGIDCMAQRFAAFCQDRFGVSDIRIDNGIVPLPGLRHRRHLNRVLIHPEASRDDKRWLPHRFIKVAQCLLELGYEVHFVIAPHERERWHTLSEAGLPVTEFDTLHDLAAWVYESGWCIANESGIGQLASNLDIPTLSLFRRRGVAERWRPAWGRTRVVLPWQWVPTAFLKERLWRQTLTCGRVLAAFQRMVHEDLTDDIRTTPDSMATDDSLIARSTLPSAPESIPDAR